VTDGFVSSVAIASSSTSTTSSHAVAADQTLRIT
jgi:hypothetical protein